MIDATEWDKYNLRGIIYAIENTITKDMYIGQTYKSFVDRYGKTWASHIHSNRNGQNNKIKNALLFYGQENFVVYILCYDVKDIDELNELEKYYINIFNTMHPFGYNLLPGGKNKPLHEETKRKIGEINARAYIFKDCMGKIHHVFNLRRFCQDNKISYSGMQNMANGRTNSSCGFGLLSTDNSLIKNPNKTHRLKHLDGRVVEFTKPVEFCKEFNVNSNIWTVLIGRDKSYKGWSLA